MQAEDRVLLWFTFPQIVALTAVCALAYGAYSYAPVESTGVRIGLAVFVGLVGLAVVVGKIGGRRLPLVAADLLQYRLGARRYAGLPSEMVRSEPPAPVESGPGPITLMARRARRGLQRLHGKKRRSERRIGRRPLRPQRWFGKHRKRMGRRHDHNGTIFVTPLSGSGRLRTGSRIHSWLGLLHGASYRYWPTGTGWTRSSYEPAEPVPMGRDSSSKGSGWPGAGPR